LIDLTPSLLPRLDAHRLPGLDGLSGVYFPCYQDQSIANLPASLLHWLGAPPLPTAALPLRPEILHHWGGHWGGEFRHVALFVLDGFGLDMLQKTLSAAQYDPRLRAWAELPQDTLLAPLTSVAPSTTATAMTTFWSGAYPAEHGVIGYTMYLKEYSMVANMIVHNPASFSGDPGSLRQTGFRSTDFVPAPMLGTHLAGRGYRVNAYTHRAIARSGLSEMLYQGAHVWPVHTLGDMFIQLADGIDEAGNEPSCSYLYWSELDDLAHRHGPGSSRWNRELADFSLQLGFFLEDRKRKARGDTLFILTADHGHIHTPKNAEFELRNQPDLLDCMVMTPNGESRLAYTFLKPGKEARFRDLVEAKWPGRFQIVNSEQFIRSGMFGSRGQHPRLAERAGDCVVIAAEGDYWWSDLFRENPLLGRHGGLSRAEMLVPLLAMRL